MSLVKNNNEKVIHHIAKASLKDSKVKNIFMIVTICLAICFIMVLGLVSLNYKTYERQIIKGMQDCIYYEVSEEQISGLKSNPDLKCVMEYKSGFEKEIGKIKIMPIYFDYEVQEIKTYELVEGNFPSEPNEVVVDKLVARELGVKEKVGEEIEIAGETFKIVGLMDGGKSIYYGTLFSKAYSQTGALFQNSKRDVLIKISENSQISNANDIKAFFYDLGKNYGIERKNVNINDKFVDTFSVNLLEVKTFIVLSIIVLMISGIVIYSIFYLSVSSKVKEYAQLRTIGMSKRQIKKLIKKEGLEYCKIAIPLGIVIGSVISYVTSPNGWTILNVLKLAVVSSILGIIAIFISVIKPAKKASEVSPIEGLRYTGNNEDIKESNQLCRSLSPSSLGKIEFGRNRKKTKMTFISLMIGGILFIGSMTFANSLDNEKYARNGMFKNCEYHIGFSAESMSQAPNGRYGLISQKNHLTKIKQELEKLEEIDCVKSKNSYSIKMETNQEMIEDEVSPMHETLQEAMKKSLQDGTGDLEELTQKGEAYITYNNVFKEIYGYDLKVGDTIILHYFNGEDNQIELTIGGVGNSSFSEYSNISGWVLVPENIYNEMTEGLDTTDELEVATKNHRYDEKLDNQVKDIVKKYEDISCTTYSEWYQTAKESSESFTNTIIGVSIFIILFSMINLINTVITSMVTRKREMAVLQSMGMTKKQLNQMIVFENICLAVPNCMVSSVIGPSVVWAVIRIFEKFGLHYMEFHLPILAILLYLLISILVPSSIAFYCIRIFNKASIVERLREN